MHLPSLKLAISAIVMAMLLALSMSTVLWAGAHGKNKAPKKAILLVTFGTSIPQAAKSFDIIQAAYEKAFPGVELRWAFTAKIIRDKLKKQGKVLDSPEVALAKLMAQGYNQIVVQSLHVICGAEWHDLLKKVHGFRSMERGFRVITGRPLLSTTDDLRNVAELLLANAPKARKNGEALVYMGHGTHHPGGVAYPAMAYLLQKDDPLAFMGTVEGYPTLDDVVAGLKAAKVKKAYLLPFMTVAGDHATNDMAGDEADSWKSILTKNSITAVPVMKAITTSPAIVQVWVEHTKVALKHFK